MGETDKDILKLLKELNSNVEILIKVTAISLRKESIFKDKITKQEQIEALDDLNLPDKLIALVIGSTPGSVQNARSLRKAKGSKGNPVAKTQVSEVKVNEQTTKG
jgi:hypothetical protein